MLCQLSYGHQAHARFYQQESRVENLPARGAFLKEVSYTRPATESSDLAAPGHDRVTVSYRMGYGDKRFVALRTSRGQTTAERSGLVDLDAYVRSVFIGEATIANHVTQVVAGTL